MTTTTSSHISLDERYTPLAGLDTKTITTRLTRLDVIDIDHAVTVETTARSLINDMSDTPPGRVIESYLATCDTQPAQDRWAIIRTLELLANSPHPARPIPAPITHRPGPDNPFETALLRLTALTTPSRITTVAALETGAPSADLTTLTVQHLTRCEDHWTTFTINGTTYTWPVWARPHLDYEFALATGDDWLLAGTSRATDLRRRQSTLLMRRRDNESAAGYVAPQPHRSAGATR